MSLEVGCLKERDVITKDGKMIGVMTGAEIDSESWKVQTVAIDLEKEMIKPLGLEKSMLKGTKIKISTSLIGLVGDIVQLNVDFKYLKDSLL
jgi:sporulation protein YlmC with PRC-barrel domain